MFCTFKCKFVSDSVFTAESSGWSSGVHDHFVAVAEYDFDAQNHDELTFKQGVVLNVAPKGLLIVNILTVC